MFYPGLTSLLGRLHIRWQKSCLATTTHSYSHQVVIQSLDTFSHHNHFWSDEYISTHYQPPSAIFSGSSLIRGIMVCLTIWSKFLKLSHNSLTRVGSSTHFAKDPLNCYQRSLFSLLSSTINSRFYHYSLWILLPSLDLMITSSLAQQLVRHVTKAVVSIFCENWVFYKGFWVLFIRMRF